MKYFGTDGFRGRANEGLTVDHAFAIGRFVGWYYGLREGRKAKVVIGKDTRRSSYMFEYALGAGLVASGTEPMVRVMVEAATPAICEQYVGEVVRVRLTEAFCYELEGEIVRGDEEGEVA